MNSSTDHSGIGSRITRYGIILSISGILCKIMLLVYTVLAVEKLGQEQFGRIEYFIEMAIIFSVLIDFGLEQTITREISRRRDQLQHFLYSLLLFRFSASFLGAVMMTIVMRLLAQPGHTWALLLSSLTYLIVVTNIMFVRAIVRSFELMTFEGIANVLDKVVHIGLAIFFLYYFPKLPLIVLCYTAGSLISLIIYFYVILNRFGIRITSFSVWEWIDWQKAAVPIGLSATCILLLHREDTAMVNWICGDAETGLYRAPYRFLEGLFLFPQVIAISAYPIFSKLYHENQSFQQSASVLLRGLLLISLPIAVGGTYVAGDMMLWLTPELGKQGGRVFQLLLWSLPFIYANFLLGTVLNATNRQRLNVYASAWGLISNAVINIPAIYFYGAYGASLVTTASQGLYCLIMVYYTRDLHLIQDTRSYIVMGLSCCIMLISLQLIHIHWMSSIPVGMAVYLLALVALQGITKNDFDNLWRVFVRK